MGDKKKAREAPPEEVARPPELPVAAVKEIPLVENLLAPEVFASDAQAISLVQGMISISFVSARYDYAETPGMLKKVVVSRLVIPPAAASSMAVRLFAFLEKNGMGAAPKDPKKVQ